MATLVQLKVSDPSGKVERELIVSKSISMYNLHRALQFCLKPSQSDSAIDGMGFTFHHKASGKLVKAPKSTQLHRANLTTSKSEVEVGEAYLYQPADKGRYLVEVVATAGGDDKNYVPRCISGNTDVDKINKKLLTRRFTKTGAGQSKKPPAVWCSRGTPASEIVASHLASMREALTPSGWC